MTDTELMALTEWVTATPGEPRGSLWVRTKAVMLGTKRRGASHRSIAARSALDRVMGSLGYIENIPTRKTRAKMRAASKSSASTEGAER